MSDDSQDTLWLPWSDNLWRYDGYSTESRMHCQNKCSQRNSLPYDTDWTPARVPTPRDIRILEGDSRTLDEIEKILVECQSARHAPECMERIRKLLVARVVDRMDERMSGGAGKRGE